MSLAKQLRASRIGQLHTELIENSRKYPTFNHLAIDTESASLIDQASLGLSNPRFETKHIDETGEECTGCQVFLPKDFTYATLQKYVPGFSALFDVAGSPRIGAMVGRFESLQFDSDFWYGSFHIAAESFSLADEAKHIFCTLCDQLADEFIGKLSIRSLSMPSSWLQLVYQTFPDCRHTGNADEINRKCRFAWLPTNVFLASAKAVEALLASKEDSSIPPKSAKPQIANGSQPDISAEAQPNYVLIWEQANSLFSVFGNLTSAISSLVSEEDNDLRATIQASLNQIDNLLRSEEYQHDVSQCTMLHDIFTQQELLTDDFNPFDPLYPLVQYVACLKEISVEVESLLIEMLHGREERKASFWKDQSRRVFHLQDSLHNSISVLESIEVVKDELLRRARDVRDNSAPHQIFDEAAAVCENVEIGKEDSRKNEFQLFFFKFCDLPDWFLARSNSDAKKGRELPDGPEKLYAILNNAHHFIENTAKPFLESCINDREPYSLHTDFVRFKKDLWVLTILCSEGRRLFQKFEKELAAIAGGIVTACENTGTSAHEVILKIGNEVIITIIGGCTIDGLVHPDSIFLKEYLENLELSQFENETEIIKKNTSFFCKEEFQILGEKLRSEHLILESQNNINSSRLPAESNSTRTELLPVLSKRISVSLQPPQINFQGMTYQVEPDGALLIDSLVKAEGEWISGSNLSMRADRVKKKLPEPIANLIESERGKGHRIPRNRLA